MMRDQPNKRVQLRDWFLVQIIAPTVDDYYLPHVSADASENQNIEPQCVS